MQSLQGLPTDKKAKTGLPRLVCAKIEVTKQVHRQPNKSEDAVFILTSIFSGSFTRAWSKREKPWESPL